MNHNSKQKDIGLENARLVERSLTILTRAGILTWEPKGNDARAHVDVRLENMNGVGKPEFFIGDRQIAPATKPFTNAVIDRLSERLTEGAAAGR